MASKLTQLQSKACQASKFFSKHGSAYYKQLLEQNKQYIQDPPSVEKCNLLSKQLLYTRLASIPVRNEAFWKELDYVKQLWKHRQELKVEDAGIAALFGLECFAWFCAGEIVGRGFTFTFEGIKLMASCPVAESEIDEEIKLGSYGGKVRALRHDEESAAEETMLLWGMQQPTFSKPNSFVSHSSLQLNLDACGHCLSILQSPSSLSTPGVTGSVMWDSGVVLGKFLEHAVDSGLLLLHGKKVIELGSGCGLVGCIAALLGAEVTLTDLPDRLRLLKKNIETNLRHGNVRGSAVVKELIWGDDPDQDLIDPFPDYVLGSDVVYSEGAVVDLLDTLVQLCGAQTTIFLAGELRNDAVLEYFFDAAMKEFIVGRVEQTQWHPDYCSPRVAMYVLVKK